MLPAPDLAWRRGWLHGAQPSPAPRLQSLLQRWQLEARAIATALAEIEAERDEVQRDLMFHRLLGELRPDLLRRVEELHAECDVLATELAHVQMALVGVRTELDLRRDHRDEPDRTSA